MGERNTFRLGVGLAGCGFQGEHWAQCLAGHPRLRLVACCDADRTRANELAARHGVDSVDDFSALLARDDVDTVVIATTTDTHAALAIAAAEAGAHVVLEKPMATTVADCLAIEEAVAAAGVCLMVGFKFRFAPALVAARRAVPAPLVLVAHTMYDATQPTAGWLADPAKSGGRLVSSLVHSVDALRVLAGSEPVRVSAEGGALAFPSSGEADNVVAVVRFASGAVASMVHGAAGRSPILSNWSFQSIGLGVNATVHDHGRAAAIHRASAGADGPSVVDPVDDPFQAGMRDLLDEFAAAIDRGAATSATARDGTLSLLVSQQIVSALHSGETIDVAAEFALALGGAGYTVR